MTRGNEGPKWYPLSRHDTRDSAREAIRGYKKVSELTEPRERFRIQRDRQTGELVVSSKMVG